MKKILAALLALVSSVTFGATLVPIQLLNPAGSTAGQMLVSNGPSGVPAWTNHVSNTSAGAQVIEMTGNGATTPNKFLGVLNGLFTIYSSSGGSQLLSVDDSGNGIFTGSITPSQTGGIVGTTTNNNASVGSVGEFISSNVPFGSAVALSSGVPANVTSISLTAGDWDVWGSVWTNPGGTTVQAILSGAISTTSATVPTSPNAGGSVLLPYTATTGAIMGSPVGMTRLSLSSTTTVYLVISINFSGSTDAGYGFIAARRRR